MRPVTVSITGLTASANAIGLSQSHGGASAAGVVFDGALASGYSATSISGSASGVTSATLTAAAGNIDPPRQIVLVSGGNDTAKTATVVGVGATGAPQTEAVLLSNASRTATTKFFSKVTSITLSSASATTFSAGVNGFVTVTQPRRISFTSGGADGTATLTFAVTGTDAAGAAISETVAAVDNPSVAYTVLSYKTITSIIASKQTASTLTVGTAADSISGGAAHSPWVRFDDWAPSFISLQATVSGTANYTIQTTLDDPNTWADPVAITSMTWVNSSDANVVGASSTQQSNFMFAPKWARVVLNSGSGSVTTTFLQSSNGPK